MASNNQCPSSPDGIDTQMPHDMQTVLTDTNKTPYNADRRSLPDRFHRNVCPSNQDHRCNGHRSCGIVLYSCTYNSDCNWVRMSHQRRAHCNSCPSSRERIGTNHWCDCIRHHFRTYTSVCSPIRICHPGMDARRCGQHIPVGIHCCRSHDRKSCCRKSHPGISLCNQNHRSPRGMVDCNHRRSSLGCRCICQFARHTMNCCSIDRRVRSCRRRIRAHILSRSWHLKLNICLN